jgi:two-component system cell cycle sensor histidine kinase/response regulator CckA
MSEDVRSRVFEPFFTTKGRQRTTGLGLSTAYGIVSQHNGNVTVYSTPGHGTTFRIYLPLADQSKATERTLDLKTSAGDVITVLAAEDDYIVRNILVHILQNLGFAVLEAEDSVQAQSLFDKHKDSINLLFTDVMMPENGGVQLAADLRKIKPDLPVIFASGYPESHLRQTGVVTNGDQVVNKPLTRSAVARAIEDTMKK